MVMNRLGLLGLSLAVLLSWHVILFGGSAAAHSPSEVDPPLPRVPEGTQVRVVAAFTSEGDEEPVRIAAHPESGRLYVLGGGGDVYVVDAQTQSKRRLWGAEDYIEQPERQDLNIPLPIDAKWVNGPITLRATLCLGLTFDRKGRLYIVANVQLPADIFINRVDIYRTGPISEGTDPEKPELWTRFDYPYGVGGFNHGACRIAQGPDGMIYLGSGSRTDHGETGDLPHISTFGEGPHPDIPGGPGFSDQGLTACILRFDPERGMQEPEVFSRGNRNPFGFDWDGQGRMIDVENGPNADHPEEINVIRQGKHYGFPYVFANGEAPAYDDAVEAPDSLTLEPPVRNVGPGGLIGVTPMYSMTPHAAPTGLVYYGHGELPERYHRTFFMARYGNLANYERIGFDVLNFRIEEVDGVWTATTDRFLDRLNRPIDLCVSGGKLYIVEYCQQNETSGPGSDGYTKGGRVLEVSAAN